MSAELISEKRGLLKHWNSRIVCVSYGKKMKLLELHFTQNWEIIENVCIMIPLTWRGRVNLSSTSLTWIYLKNALQMQLSPFLKSCNFRAIYFLFSVWREFIIMPTWNSVCVYDCCTFFLVRSTVVPTCATTSCSRFMRKCGKLAYCTRLI